MGLPAFLRSVGAAARRVERENARQARCVAKDRQKQARQLGAHADRTEHAATVLDSRLAVDPISAIEIEYMHGEGLVAKPFFSDLAGVSGRVDVLPSRRPIEPVVLVKTLTCTITVLDVYPTSFATLIALSVESSTPGRLDFVRKNDLKKSSTFLVSKPDGKYVFPLSTDFVGAIVQGIPRIGVVAFPPLMESTKSI